MDTFHVLHRAGSAYAVLWLQKDFNFLCFTVGWAVKAVTCNIVVQAARKYT